MTGAVGRRSSLYWRLRRLDRCPLGCPGLHIDVGTDEVASSSTHWGHLKTIVHGHPARLPVGWWPGCPCPRFLEFLLEIRCCQDVSVARNFQGNLMLWRSSVQASAQRRPKSELGNEVDRPQNAKTPPSDPPSTHHTRAPEDFLGFQVP